ncbi:nitrate- and nitrite sensing domain-containing protein [Halomonadaceae bacterium KBTZ08]
MAFFLSTPFVVTAALLLGLAGSGAVLVLRQHHRHRRRRRQQLAALRSLCDLIQNLQRHRGLSTGVLSGGSGMQQELASLHQHLDRVFREAPMSDARYAERWLGLEDHWRRLRQTGNRSVEANLNQHHQIIRNTLFLIQDIAADDRVAPHPANHHCIWHEVLEAAEWAGQARALGTAMAAAGHSSAAQRVRLRFLREKIRDLSSIAFEALSQAQPAKVDANQLEDVQKAVDQLLHEMDSDLLAATPIVIPAQTFFQDATATVDALFSLVAATLEAMADDASSSGP